MEKLDKLYANAHMLAEYPTKSEKSVRAFLEGCGFTFQEVLFGFIPDFVHFEKKLVVEIDGLIHEQENQRERDRYKDEVFRKNGYRIIRITNDEIYKDVKKVFDKLFLWINLPGDDYKHLDYRDVKKCVDAGLDWETIKGKFPRKFHKMLVRYYKEIKGVTRLTNKVSKKIMYCRTCQKKFDRCICKKD